MKKKYVDLIKAAKRELQKAQKELKASRLIEMQQAAEQEKVERLLAGPESNEAKKQAVKQQKQQAKADGTLNQEVGYPHSGRSQFIQTAIGKSIIKNGIQSVEMYFRCFNGSKRWKMR